MSAALVTGAGVVFTRRTVSFFVVRHRGHLGGKRRSARAALRKWLLQREGRENAQHRHLLSALADGGRRAGHAHVDGRARGRVGPTEASCLAMEHEHVFQRRAPVTGCDLSGQ
jgi:hypothetical protein